MSGIWFCFGSLAGAEETFTFRLEDLRSVSSDDDHKHPERTLRLKWRGSTDQDTIVFSSEEERDKHWKTLMEALGFTGVGAKTK